MPAPFLSRFLFPLTLARYILTPLLRKRATPVVDYIPLPVASDSQVLRRHSYIALHVSLVAVF